MIKFKESEELPSSQNLLSKRNHKKLTFKNKNQPSKDKTMKKIIYLPLNQDSITRIEINYSQIQNLKNQSVFKKNVDFFAKESLNSLLKTLKNTKIPKSSKVEAD